MVVIAVGFLKLLIGHELDGSMRCPKEAGQVAFVQPPHTFITKQIDQPVSETPVLHVAGDIGGIREAEAGLHHPDGVG